MKDYLKVLLVIFLLIPGINHFGQDSVVYWKRYASAELYPVGLAFDFKPQQEYGDHYSIGFLELAVGITESKHPILFSSGLSGVSGRPFLDILSNKKGMNIPSFRLGMRLLKTREFEIDLTSGVGFVLNQIDRTIRNSNIPGLSSSYLRIGYYPLKHIGFAIGTSFYKRSDIAVMTNCVSISFRNGL